MCVQCNLIYAGFIFCGFPVFTDFQLKFVDAGASGVDIFADVQISIVQCLLHWCSGLSLLSRTLSVPDCHKKFFSHSCEAATTFR